TQFAREGSVARSAQAPSSSVYLKNEIQTGMPWRVEILNEIVAAEIAALPADMQARFLRLSERIGQAGLEGLGEPHVKHRQRMSRRSGYRFADEDMRQRVNL